MKKCTCILLLLSLFSCSKTKEQHPDGNRPATTFFHSFVTCYTKGEGYTPTYGDKWLTIQLTGKNRTAIFSPDLAGVADQANATEFRRLSERNGDTSYNREYTYLVTPGRECLADNFSKIEVICTNCDLDAAHPAGSLLNDLMRIAYKTYAPYIRSGYAGEVETYVEKPLAALEEDDLMLLKPLLHVRFNDDVRKDVRFELEITLTTTEGKTYPVHAVFRPM